MKVYAGTQAFALLTHRHGDPAVPWLYEVDCPELKPLAPPPGAWVRFLIACGKFWRSL